MSTANCPRCGRFARATWRAVYTGTWNDHVVTTYCQRCGTMETSTV